MKTLLLSLAYVCSWFTYGLQAEQPDFSNSHTYHEVCDQLNGVNISHLDFRILRANTLLNSSKLSISHINEFPGLRWISEMQVEYKSPAKVVPPEIVIGNLVCEVDCKINLKNSFFGGHPIEYRVKATQEIYIALLDLAKQEINHLLSDENFEVIFYVSNGDQKNGVWQPIREPICKWENGQGLYYAKFMENEQSVSCNVKESVLTEAELLQILKN